MENKSHALAAGAFVLLLAALVAGLVMWLTRDSGDYQTYELTTREGVSGLQPQAAVRYKGVAVGRVRYIGFDPQVPGNVLIRIEVEESTPLTPSTFAVLNYQGVTGLTFVQLDDDGRVGTPLPPGQSGYPRLPLRASPFSMLADQGPELMMHVSDAVQRINQLLGSENQQKVQEALAGIAEATHSVNRLMVRMDGLLQQRLDPALAGLPNVTKEAELALRSLRTAGEQTAALAGEVSATLNRLSAPDGALGEAGRSAQALTGALERLQKVTLPQIERASAETTRAVRQLGRVAEGVERNPQAFIYGDGAGQPGPGEPGFVMPGAR